MNDFSLVCAHGGIVASEFERLGIAGDVLDVSVNVNPFGPCDAVREAIRNANVQAYPDPTAGSARRALAGWLGVPEARVVLGNGAVDLLWTLARAWLRFGDTVLTVEPTFSELRTASLRAGARVEAHRTRSDRDFALDAAVLDDHLRTLRPRLLYACTPSNPSGHYVPAGVFADLADRHPDTLLVVDVSFLSLSAHHAERAWHASERVVWLRSLTKDHGLAGLRIGCAIAPPDVVARIDDERPPWSVNALAQAAAGAIASDDASRFVATSRARLLEACGRLAASLRSLGLRVHPSDTVFVLADLGSRATATDVRTRLLCDHRVLVRDGTSFGLPTHVRIAARPESDQARVVSALAEVLER